MGKYLKEIAQEYSVTVRTMQTWIKPLKPQFKQKKKARRKIYVSREIEIIYDHLGTP